MIQIVDGYRHGASSEKHNDFHFLGQIHVKAVDDIYGQCKDAAFDHDAEDFNYFPSGELLTTLLSQTVQFKLIRMIHTRPVHCTPYSIQGLLRPHFSAIMNTDAVSDANRIPSADRHRMFELALCSRSSRSTTLALLQKSEAM